MVIIKTPWRQVKEKPTVCPSHFQTLLPWLILPVLGVTLCWASLSWAYFYEISLPNSITRFSWTKTVPLLFTLSLYLLPDGWLFKSLGKWTNEWTGWSLKLCPWDCCFCPFHCNFRKKLNTRGKLLFCHHLICRSIYMAGAVSQGLGSATSLASLEVHMSWIMWIKLIYSETGRRLAENKPERTELALPWSYKVWYLKCILSLKTKHIGTSTLNSSNLETFTVAFSPCQALGYYHKYSRRKNSVQKMTSCNLPPEMVKPLGQNHICRLKREDGEKDAKGSKSEFPADWKKGLPGMTRARILPA